MAVPMSPKQKVYQGILNNIRDFIKKHHLQSGDRLPSERELAETLGTSRSSIREALRSMELLGLIEVRHGEGTFLSTYRPFQTVELLASFILLESNTEQEIMLIKQLLEKEGMKQTVNELSEKDCYYLQTILETEESLLHKHILFFDYIFNKTGNLFLMKIWGLMQDFTRNAHEKVYNDSFYQTLLEICKHKQVAIIDNLFNTLK